MPTFRGSQGLCLALVLLWCVGLGGCRKWLDRLETLVGKRRDPVARTAPRVRADLRLAKLRKEAIRKVQQAPARRGWTVLKEIKNYEKIAAGVAKKHKLPKPTGFDWAAVCAGGGTCKVMMGFWDGRQRHEAVWLVGTELEPLNCWALSFMARSRQALECFKKLAAQQKSQPREPAPRAPGNAKAAAPPTPGARGGVWESTSNPPTKPPTRRR